MSDRRTDEEVAAELARVLMQHARSAGPLTAVRALTRVLRILRIVTRVVTYERNRQAYNMGAIWPQRRAAELVGVPGPTMQRWMDAGREGKSESISEFTDAE